MSRFISAFYLFILFKLYVPIFLCCYPNILLGLVFYSFRAHDVCLQTDRVEKTTPSVEKTNTNKNTHNNFIFTHRD